jgi:hypothetical protein
MRRRKIGDLLHSMKLRGAHCKLRMRVRHYFDPTSDGRNSTFASGDKEMLYCREASGLSMLR